MSAASIRHRWGEKVRANDGRSSRKICERCEMICVSRHETDGRGFAQHWKEWWRGTDLIQRAGLTPLCEPVEVMGGVSDG
ncbi:cytochrome C [Bradyrhizobium sp. CCBAU 11386]|uniref:cytochrome C n=1 Tax=Bradyrhizobium sp. CCBAU 11386 TaxID=1630837 RepID=UPI0023030EE7|nr:cytochrome C [Bradyrhizobium sp. CCBAU 11386]